MLVLGGLLTGGYVMLVLIRAMGSTAEPLTSLAPVARSREAVALAMSLCAVLLGLAGARTDRAAVLRHFGPRAATIAEAGP